MKEKKTFLDKVDVKSSQEDQMSAIENKVCDPHMDVRDKSFFAFQDHDNMFMKHDYMSEMKNEEYYDNVLSSAPASECLSSDSLTASFLNYTEPNSFLVDINQVFEQNEYPFFPNTMINTMNITNIQDMVDINGDLYFQHSINDSHDSNDNFIAADSNNLNNLLGVFSLEKSPGAEKNDTISSNARQNVCFNCGVNETPLWRRSPDKKYLLCNACGLYLKQYKYMRPLGFHRKKSANSQSRSSIKMVCINCEVTETSLWRKNELGKPICNACRLYEKIHNTQRPVTMRKEQVIRRRRYKNLFEHI